MARYIEISELPNFEVKCSDGKNYVLLPFGCLSDIPTADVEEVRHGEWKPNSYIKGHYICSECGSDIDVGSMCEPRMYYPYCRCGAKMDGGKI